MTIRGIAHRGYSAKYPENTLTAFQAAIDLGFSHIELDVHLSYDGVPVLMHDFTVERMTGERGFVRDFTLAELKSLRVGNSEHVATLEEALLLAKNKATVLVELKQAGHLYPDLETTALDVIYRTGTAGQVMIIGFDHFSIVRVRELDSAIRIGITSTSSMPYVFDFMEQYRLEFLGVPMRMLTPEYYRMMTDRGINVGPWVVDTTEDMEVVLERYPESIITTNELERWADVYGRYLNLHGEPRGIGLG